MVITNPAPVPRPMEFPGATVYDAVCPVVYTDLNLSAVVGSRKALVLLEVYNNSLVNLDYQFRVNGIAVSTGKGGSAGSAANEIAASEYGYYVIMTDAAGIVEWIANQAETSRIILQWFIAMI